MDEKVWHWWSQAYPPRKRYAKILFGNAFPVEAVWDQGDLIVAYDNRVVVYEPCDNVTVEYKTGCLILPYQTRREWETERARQAYENEIVREAKRLRRKTRGITLYRDGVLRIREIQKHYKYIHRIICDGRTPVAIIVRKQGRKMYLPL